jgi:glycerophosphoryl diester phosphodiesterase
MTLSALDRIRVPRVLVLAHRGDSRQAPENTLPAFLSAAQLGVDFIELDYRHTADDVPLVFHDEYLDRATDAASRWNAKRIPLASKTLAELQSLDAGTWFSPAFAGTRLSTLAEVLAALPQACFMIERKSGSAEVCVQVLEACQATERVIVQAFDWDFLRACRQRSSGLMLGALGTKQLTESLLAEARALGASVVGWEAASLRREEISRIHAAGMQAWAWTVDDEALGQQLIDDGIDALISNRPAAMQSLLAGPGVAPPVV